MGTANPKTTIHTQKEKSTQTQHYRDGHQITREQKRKGRQ